MKIKLKISLVNDKKESFMGIGLIWLLENIKDCGSISQAAKDMDMSYAKAHRILKRLEQNLGKKILHTKSGGADRGGATLTPYAEEFLIIYNNYQKKIKTYAEKEFAEFQKELDSLEGKLE